MCLEEILSFICVVVSAVIYSYGLQLKSKNKILIMQMISCGLYILSYVFALSVNSSAMVGLITASFELLRLITYYLIDRKERVYNNKLRIAATIFFCVALTISSILVEPSLLCLLTLAGALIVTLSLAFKNIILIKVACIVQSVCTCTYLFLLGLWLNAVVQVGIFVPGIIGLIIYLKTLKFNLNNQEKENDNKKSTN